MNKFKSRNDSEKLKLLGLRLFHDLGACNWTQRSISLIELEKILLRQDVKNIFEKKTNKRKDQIIYATLEKSKKRRKLKEKAKNKSIKVGGIHSQVCYFNVNLMLSF